MEMNHVTSRLRSQNSRVTRNNIPKSVTSVQRGVNLLTGVNKAGTQFRVYKIYDYTYHIDQ